MRGGMLTQLPDYCHASRCRVPLIAKVGWGFGQPVMDLSRSRTWLNRLANLNAAYRARSAAGDAVPAMPIRHAT